MRKVLVNSLPQNILAARGIFDYNSRIFVKSSQITLVLVQMTKAKVFGTSILKTFQIPFPLQEVQEKYENFEKLQTNENFKTFQNFKFYDKYLSTTCSTFFLPDKPCWTHSGPQYSPNLECLEHFSACASGFFQEDL